MFVLSLQVLELRLRLRLVHIEDLEGLLLEGQALGQRVAEAELGNGPARGALQSRENLLQREVDVSVDLSEQTLPPVI